MIRRRFGSFRTAVQCAGEARGVLERRAQGHVTCVDPDGNEVAFGAVPAAYGKSAAVIPCGCPGGHCTSSIR
jgi:hypothetical protein